MTVKCSGCGRFMNPMADGTSDLFIPDSDYSREEHQFHCVECTTLYNQPVTTQSFGPVEYSYA